ncbi:MAG: polyprenyl synthetase family protein [Microbacteriaceae bacterium]|nr:polyprenyl synthetase family protein [Microbacteriaceae bacterium]
MSGETGKINIITATQALPAKLFNSIAQSQHLKKIERELAKIETGLLAHLEFASPIAAAPARYLAAAGGKRIRPLLALLVAELGNGSTEAVQQVAQAIEITHLASLYHDDVMDEAEMRRGVPAAHVTWNNSVAILAGDLLFARASSIVAKLGQEAMLIQTATFERLCLGQLHETVGPQNGENEREFYLQVLADKTGSLISGAIEMSVVVAEVPETLRAPLLEYAEAIGIAFQLIDDVIDLSPSKKDTGKRAGTDLRAGVITLPLLLLREKSAAGGESAAAAVDLLARIETGVAAVADGADPAVMDAEVAELRAHEVTGATEKLAREYAEKAVQALEALPVGRARDALAKLATMIVEREG